MNTISLELILISLCFFTEAICLKHYDYIIVGSGAAGAVLANRLSKDPAIQVLLLEAGECPPLAADITSQSPSLLFTSYNWNYTSIPNKKIAQGLKDRRIQACAGKILGGSPMINFNALVRGNRNDFDNWARNGAVGWDWKNVFPYFLKQEDNRDLGLVANGICGLRKLMGPIKPFEKQKGVSEEPIYINLNGYHGVGGELILQYPAFFTPLTKAYIEAAEAIGYPLGDYDADIPAVFKPNQGSLKNGKRWTTLRAFLDPIMGRRNFQLITSAFVTKILINENNRAYGVLFHHKGKELTALAKREVIVSAGTLNSPKLLMLSGIGPKEVLHKLNIPVISDLPVGQNLHDHLSTLGLLFQTNSYTSNDHTTTKEDFEEMLINGTGPLSTLGPEVVGFMNSKYNKRPDWPDITMFWLSASVASKQVVAKLSSANEELLEIFEKYKFLNTVTCVPYHSRPRSRGVLTISSKNPYDKPLIDFNFFSDPLDIKVLVEGMKYCLKLASTEPMKKFDVRPVPYVMPGCERYEMFSDEYLACLAIVFPYPIHHSSGTCKMGHPDDPTSVVDPTLKVKGVKGLRVVDASIVPQMVIGHLTLTTMMIAEKASELILYDYQTHSSGVHTNFNEFTNS